MAKDVKEVLSERICGVVEHAKDEFGLTNEEITEILDAAKADFPPDFHDVDCEQCAKYNTDCIADPSGSCFVAKR